MRRVEDSGKVSQRTRHGGTTTRERVALAEWLKAEGVTQVAMESTGVYGKPIFNILEAEFEVLLVNAQKWKHVPGRKTDVLDCPWIAQLLQHGLLQGSFIPPRWQRELRDLTRQRSQVRGEHSRISNRIQKVLEDGNIKLGSVASDVLGSSGRQMLQALMAGETDAEKLADLARLRLREKIPQRREALSGKVRDHHRWRLRLLWDQLPASAAFLARWDERIEQLTRPQQPVLEQLDAIPGIDRRVAEVLRAEIGPDRTPFPSDAHLASWAGMCPGNHESAGQKRSGKTTKGSCWLRQALMQAAWAASPKKDSYFQAHAQNLMRRRGKKRGLVAVAHSLLLVVYHMLKEGTGYRDLGRDFLDHIRSQHLIKFHVKRLQQLGFTVVVTPVAA